MLWPRLIFFLLALAPAPVPVALVTIHLKPLKQADV